MAFADLAKQHASFIAGHVLGEKVEIREGSGLSWREINAVVDRQPLSPIGEFLEKAVEVRVSAEEMTSVTLTRAEIRLPLDARPNEPAPVFAVMLTRLEGGFRFLHCEQRS